MQKKVCEVCRRPYESEDHECREAMPAMERLKGSEVDALRAERTALLAEKCGCGRPLRRPVTDRRD